MKSGCSLDFSYMYCRCSYVKMSRFCPVLSYLQNTIIPGIQNDRQIHQRAGLKEFMVIDRQNCPVPGPTTLHIASSLWSKLMVVQREFKCQRDATSLQLQLSDIRHYCPLYSYMLGKNFIFSTRAILKMIKFKKTSNIS